MVGSLSAAVMCAFMSHASGWLAPSPRHCHKGLEPGYQIPMVLSGRAGWEPKGKWNPLSSRLGGLWISRLLVLKC